MQNNFSAFLAKHKFQPMTDMFISTVDDITLRVSKLEREMDILPVDEIEIINDDNLEAPDA